MLETILNVAQIIVAILLIGAVLLQTPEGGLSPVFGGGGETFRSRRSVEKFLVLATVLLALILAALSIILLLP